MTESYRNDSLNSLCFIVPCYNEELRIHPTNFTRLLKTFDCEIVVINDGSNDGTLDILTGMAESDAKIHILNLKINLGKSNAIWEGLKFASKNNFEFAAVCDADFSVQLIDYQNGLKIIQENDNLHLVSGARISLMGGNIKRNNFRKWMGRIVATFLALMIRCDFYDIQSPCKIYRRNFFEKLNQPKTRWFHDVEFLLNSHASNVEGNVKEFVLESWQDVEGSKIGLRQYPKILIDCLRLIILSWSKRNPNAKTKKL